MNQKERVKQNEEPLTRCVNAKYEHTGDNRHPPIYLLAHFPPGCCLRTS